MGQGEGYYCSAKQWAYWWRWVYASQHMKFWKYAHLRMGVREIFAVTVTSREGRKEVNVSGRGQGQVQVQGQVKICILAKVSWYDWHYSRARFRHA